VHDSSPDLDVREILRVLDEYNVQAVITGGVAAIAHGADLVTQHLDTVPWPDEANLARLSAALRAMKAEVRSAGEVPNLPDGEWLRSSRIWNFRTLWGDLDVLFAPAGAPDYEELVAASQLEHLGDGTEVRIASLDDLIAMKKAAGDPKICWRSPFWTTSRHGVTTPRRLTSRPSARRTLTPCRKPAATS
jgi:hypothetical protein